MKNTISASPSFFGPAFPTPLKQYLGVGEASRVGRRNELMSLNFGSLFYHSETQQNLSFGALVQSVQNQNICICYQYQKCSLQ